MMINLCSKHSRVLQRVSVCVRAFAKLKRKRRESHWSPVSSSQPSVHTTRPHFQKCASNVPALTYALDLFSHLNPFLCTVVPSGSAVSFVPPPGHPAAPTSGAAACVSAPATHTGGQTQPGPGSVE